MVILTLRKNNGAEKVEETCFRSVVMYLTTTRPDILYAFKHSIKVYALSIEVHLQATKRIVRYIKGTIKFQKSQPVKLFKYSDSDWGGSMDDSKSGCLHINIFL